jgi:hypothetical protein
MTIKVQRGSRDSLDAIEPLWKAMLEHHEVLTGDQFPMREPAEAWARGTEFWSVDVVESNPAVRLYERAGFRPNYRKMFGRVDP